MSPHFLIRFLMFQLLFPLFLWVFPVFPLVFLPVSYFRSYAFYVHCSSYCLNLVTVYKDTAIRNMLDKLSRICSKQIYRPTVPPDSNRKDEIESYCLRNIAIRFLDNVCVGLNELFKCLNSVFSRLLYLVPSIFR